MYLCNFARYKLLTILLNCLFYILCSFCVQQGIQYLLRAMLTNVSDVTVTVVRLIYCKYIQIAFQTELTCQRIQEFETQASSDLELRNNKIDELNRVSIVIIMIISLFTYFHLLLHQN